MYIDKGENKDKDEEEEEEEGGEEEEDEKTKNKYKINDEKCGVDGTLKHFSVFVVAGVDAIKNKWRWQVGLYYFSKFFCGGSLITPLHVLTAAHCVATRRAEGITVVAGDHDRYVCDGVYFSYITSRYNEFLRTKTFVMLESFIMLKEFTFSFIISCESFLVQEKKLYILLLVKSSQYSVILSLWYVFSRIWQ